MHIPNDLFLHLLVLLLSGWCQVAVQASHIDNISLPNLNGGDHEAGCTLVGSTNGN